MSFGLSLTPFNVNNNNDDNDNHHNNKNKKHENDDEYVDDDLSENKYDNNNNNNNNNPYSDDIPPSTLLTSSQLIRHNSLSKSKRNKSNELASSAVILGFNLYWLLCTSIYINIEEFVNCLCLSKSVYITLDKQVIWKKLFIRDFPFVKLNRNIFHYDYYNAYQLYYQLIRKDYNLFRILKEFYCIKNNPPLENIEDTEPSRFIPIHLIKEYEEYENNFKIQIIETNKILKEYEQLSHKLNKEKELIIQKRAKELQEHEQKIAEAVKNNLGANLQTTELKRQTTDEDLDELEREIDIKLQAHSGYGLDPLTEADNNNPVPVFELNTQYYHLFWALMNYEVDAGIDLLEPFQQHFIVFIDQWSEINIRSSQTSTGGSQSYIPSEEYPNLYNSLHLFLFSPILFRLSHSSSGIEEFYRYKEYSLKQDISPYKDYFNSASSRWKFLERFLISLTNSSHLINNINTIQRVLPTSSLNSYLRRLEGLCIQTNFAISKKNAIFDLITIFIQGNNVRIVTNHYDNDIVYNVISFNEEVKKQINESENNKNNTHKNNNSLSDIKSQYSNNANNPSTEPTKKKYRRRKTRKRLWKKHLLREKELKNRAKYRTNKENLDPDEGKLKQIHSSDTDSDIQNNNDNSNNNNNDSEENNNFQPSSSSDEEAINSNNPNQYSLGPISKIYSAIRLHTAEKMNLIDSADLSVGILIIERISVVGHREKPITITIRTDEIDLKNQTIQVNIERGNAKPKKEKWTISKLNE